MRSKDEASHANLGAPDGLPRSESRCWTTSTGTLLAELGADPRASAAELARRVGMSAPAVRERVARLEEAGVIRGYRLDVDPAAIGLPVAGVGAGPARAGPAAEDRRAGRADPARSASATASPARTASCSRCTWRRIDDLEAVLDRFLLYGQTTSSFVVSTPVPTA